MKTLSAYRRAAAGGVAALSAMALFFPKAAFAVGWIGLAVVGATRRARRARAIKHAELDPKSIEWFDYPWFFRYGGWLIYSGFWFLLVPLSAPADRSWAKLFEQLLPPQPWWGDALMLLLYAVMLSIYVGIPIGQMLASLGAPRVGLSGSRLVLIFPWPLAPHHGSVGDVSEIRWVHIYHSDHSRLPSFYRVKLTDGTRFLVFPSALPRCSELLARLRREP